MPGGSNGGWPEWGRHVLKEIERLDDGHTDNAKRLNQHDIDITMLKVKCGLLGLLAGSVPSVITLLITIFSA